MKYKIPGSILWTLHIAAIMTLSQTVEGDEEPLVVDCLEYCEAK